MTKPSLGENDGIQNRFSNSTELNHIHVDDRHGIPVIAVISKAEKRFVSNRYLHTAVTYKISSMGSKRHCIRHPGTACVVDSEELHNRRVASACTSGKGPPFIRF